MKKITRIFIICFVAIALVACSGDTNEHLGEAKTPSSSSVQEGKDYQEVINDFEEQGFKNIKTEKLEDLITGWLTKDGEVESVAVDGNIDFSADEWYPEDVEIVITYHTFPEDEEEIIESEDDDKIVDVEDSESEDVEIEDEQTEEAEEIITAENNEELAAVLTTKIDNDPIFGEFAKKYEGRTIEFDGYIAHMVQHGNYKTRFNFLIMYGDYRETDFSGPSFHYEDVSVFDLNLIGTDIPDTIGTGDKLRIKAVIEEYDEDPGLFKLDPVSTEFR